MTLTFARHGHDWPNRDASRFVDAAGLSWHVQVMGAGPVLLLLHGTGASTHSWRDVLPLLAQRFTVIAPDLPGHAFTEMPPRHRLALPAQAAALGELVRALGVEVSAVAGHSAGAAIALRMALDRHIAPSAIVSLCGALMPFPGAAAALFPALAKVLFLNPLAAPFLARMARGRAAVERLLAGTGSSIDARGIDLYARLFADAGHVGATIGMMAHWDLVPLRRDLPALAAALTLVAAANDSAVPPSVADAAHALVAHSRVIRVKGGHLFHEESPHDAARVIMEATAA